MSATNPRSNLECEPLTIAHGKRLYEQAQKISEQIGQLTPLLSLLEPPDRPPEQDPIGHILRYLEALVTLAEHQTARIAEIDAKLNVLISTSNIELP